MRRFEEMILDFISILERMGIDYVIIGGVAVSSWGTPRTTRDLDVITVLETKNINELSENLREMGFSVDINDFKESLQEKTHFTIELLKKITANCSRSVKTRYTISCHLTPIISYNPIQNHKSNNLKMRKNHISLTIILKVYQDKFIKYF